MRLAARSCMLLPARPQSAIHARSFAAAVSSDARASSDAAASRSEEASSSPDVSTPAPSRAGNSDAESRGTASAIPVYESSSVDWLAHKRAAFAPTR